MRENAHEKKVYGCKRGCSRVRILRWVTLTAVTSPALFLCSPGQSACSPSARYDLHCCSCYHGPGDTPCWPKDLQIRGKILSAWDNWFGENSFTWSNQTSLACLICLEWIWDSVKNARFFMFLLRNFYAVWRNATDFCCFRNNLEVDKLFLVIADVLYELSSV